ncbi:MAG TPA: peptidyl-prolyl cis-trans isomerase, partial [Acidimicrobiia bacterium]|nr:peptidyl-prolyl cis-trans isomerase [Acidimicrobiia bacterium]
ALADRVAADEAAAGEAAAGREWDGSAPAAKEKGPSKLALVGVAVVALLAGAGTAYAVGHHGGGCPGKGNALKIEGTTISTGEFQRRVELLRALYDVRPPTDPKQQASFYGDAAKGMAQGVLVSHDVTKRHLQAADKTVQDRLDRFIAQRYPQGGRDQFIQALGNYGVSEADVLGEFRRIIETSSLFQNVSADVKVTEDQITQAFAQRQDQLAVPEKRHLKFLVVATQDDANKALTRIRGRETFEQVAKAVSIDPTTKGQGGDLGEVAKAQLDPAFGAAAFSAAKGATFGPVQTAAGWNVGLVVDITPGHAVTLAEVHDSLRDTLVGEAKLALWRQYLADRLRGANACYAKANRPADPKAPPADVTPANPAPGAPESTTTTAR